MEFWYVKDSFALYDKLTQAFLEKFLVDKHGNVRERYSSMTKPETLKAVSGDNRWVKFKVCIKCCLRTSRSSFQSHSKPKLIVH